VIRLKRLRTRILVAGALMVLSTLGISLWSAWTFARLSAVVDNTLGDSQSTIDATTALATSLEREDDALLLAISKNRTVARANLASERERGEGQYKRLISVIKESETNEIALARQLRQEIDSYRRAGSNLVASADTPGALERYHEQVNPLLRQAVSTSAKIREANFQEMQQAGLSARDQARKSVWLVIALTAAALAMVSVAAVWLARSVLVPVRELTASVEALRQGDFDQRVPSVSTDELGRLAAGFNRMAESLSEYRRSSLGELLAAKTTLEATLNALADAVFVISPDGKLIAANPPAKAVMQAKGAGRASRLEELPLSVEHRDAVNFALAGHRRNGSRTDFDHTLPVTLGGQRHRLLVSALPIPEFLPGRTGAVVVLDDVTEFAQLDELRTELIGVASHELKTPLTSLRMNLMLLVEEAANLTPRQREILSAATAGCEELFSTIEELLDVTRIEAGQLRLNLATVDAYHILEHAVDRLKARFDDSRIEVRLERDADPALARADTARLGLVVTNLLTNALKYAPAGGTVTIRVSTTKDAADRPRGSLLVTVTDTGPGIPAEFRERVFEKFFRVEHQSVPDERRIPGTGIGLYLCREIIKAHGGSIWCEPGDNAIGTRVAIRLPVVG
jgi:two-component system, NtrC family, sensor histidine kinase KinB